MNAPLSISILLTAIAMVETGNDPRPVGKHGETGRYQMSPSFRHDFHSDPAQGLLTIAKDLSAAGIEPCAFNLALAYSAGRDRVINHPQSIPIAKYRYAQRVENLYESLVAGQAGRLGGARDAAEGVAVKGADIQPAPGAPVIFTVSGSAPAPASLPSVVLVNSRNQGRRDGEFLFRFRLPETETPAVAAAGALQR